MNTTENMLQAMKDFSDSYRRLLIAADDYESATKQSVNDIPGFIDNYPFNVSFDELTIHQWVDDVTRGLSKPKFAVLSSDYLNTGGGCMVGVSEVFLSDENRTVYVFVNEEGATISTVDHVRKYIDIEDYDEVTVDYIDWGRITGYEKYFELYRYCFNQYLVADCIHCKYTKRVPYILLSDELQQTIDADYVAWCLANSDGLFETNGRSIFVDDSYRSDDESLEAVKKFKRWHDTTAGEEEYYSEKYALEIAGRRIELPFMADIWDAVDQLLETAIENW